MDKKYIYWGLAIVGVTVLTYLVVKNMNDKKLDAPTEGGDESFELCFSSLCSTYSKEGGKYFVSPKYGDNKGQKLALTKEQFETNKQIKNGKA